MLYDKISKLWYNTVLIWGFSVKIDIIFFWWLSDMKWKYITKKVMNENLSIS